MYLILKFCDIEAKFNAGHTAKVSNLARTFDEVSGSIFVFVRTNPIAMNKKSVSIGVSDEKNISFIANYFAVKSKRFFLYSSIAFLIISIATSLSASRLTLVSFSSSCL